MKRFLVPAVAAFALAAALPAWAGGSQRTTVNDTSGSYSGARANAINGGDTTTIEGSKGATNTPDVVPPALAGGANPCVQSTAVGIGVQGFGASFGSTYPDKDCQLRAWYINILNTAVTEKDPRAYYAAKVIFCSADVIRGLDLPYCAPARPAQVSQNPMPSPHVRTAAAALPAIAPRPFLKETAAARPAWCATVDGTYEQHKYDDICHPR